MFIIRVIHDCPMKIKPHKIENCRISFCLFFCFPNLCGSFNKRYDICFNLEFRNNFYRFKFIHKLTYFCPHQQGKKNEIYFICLSKRWRSSFQNVSVCGGAEWNCDHVLHARRLKLRFNTI